jgi:small subunit ribosomal protein S15
MLTTEQTKEIVTKFGGNEKNSGLPEVQVAIMTAKIDYLSKHFNTHKLDHHSKTGLMKIIGKRRRMLRYISNQNPERYTKLIQALGLRK